MEIIKLLHFSENDPKSVNVQNGAKYTEKNLCLQKVLRQVAQKVPKVQNVANEQKVRNEQKLAKSAKICKRC